MAAVGEVSEKIEHLVHFFCAHFTGALNLPYLLFGCLQNQENDLVFVFEMWESWVPPFSLNRGIAKLVSRSLAQNKFCYSAQRRSTPTTPKCL